MHQYLFFIGDFPIRAYGAMLALASSVVPRLPMFY